MSPRRSKREPTQPKYMTDEMSMSMMTDIDSRLCQAFPLRSQLPFGEMFIVLLGDLGQLPPVMHSCKKDQNLQKEFH
jgi:hypothetical protein